MSWGPCPYANRDCKYWEAPPRVSGEASGCYSDKQHIFGKAEAKRLGGLAVEFANLARNTVNLCRAQHEEWDEGMRWRPGFPPKEIMAMIIKADKERL